MMDTPNPHESPKANATTPSPGPSVTHKTGKLRKDKHPTASLLFGVAVIQFLVGLFFWSIHGSEFTSLDWACSLSFLVFVALGFWARWAPAVPATIGFLLYHVGDDAGVLELQRGLEVADMLAAKWGPKCYLGTLIDRCVQLGYEWGVSDGN